MPGSTTKTLRIKEYGLICIIDDAIVVCLDTDHLILLADVQRLYSISTNGTAVHKACDTRGLCFLQLLTELLSGSLHEGVAVATAFEDPWLDAA
ncbi:MAG TPA: hypothetical protein VLI39_15835, partial [Sedimentisphaerales bacterium]|nr:hypothetical protein [Sedimentisphaerales bacterium]